MWLQLCHELPGPDLDYFFVNFSTKKEEVFYLSSDEIENVDMNNKYIQMMINREKPKGIQ